MARASDPAVKRLLVASNNNCAFPECTSPLVEDGVFVGEICHIRSASKGHRRYDPDQNEEERHGYDNLMLLCRKHHKIVDTDVTRYPPALLTEMKRAHESVETKRFTISDAVAQKLGAMLAVAPVEPPAAPAPNSGPSHPNWTIRELFFHLRPDLADDPEAKGWERVKSDVMDQFSTGALRVWGRPRVGVGKRGALKKVDERHYWQHAEFAPWFLREDGVESNHVIVKKETGLPDYSDLRINEVEALSIWPGPGRPDDDRIEIMLLDAARRAYSQTRGTLAAEMAERAGGPEDILKWYCVWVATHTQLYGARRPSNKMELVTLDTPAKDFELRDNTLTLKERYGHVVYENLRIKFDVLPVMINELKSYREGGEAKDD